MGYPGKKSTPVIAAKAASYEGFSYMQSKDNSAKEAFPFQLCYFHCITESWFVNAYKPQV